MQADSAKLHGYILHQKNSLSSHNLWKSQALGYLNRLRTGDNSSLARGVQMATRRYTSSEGLGSRSMAGDRIARPEGARRS